MHLQESAGQLQKRGSGGKKHLKCMALSLCQQQFLVYGKPADSLNKALTCLLQCRFQHGYDNYMLHAFPHDELKPLTQDFTDSLGKPCVDLFFSSICVLSCLNHMQLSLFGIRYASLAAYGF